jgi:arginine deiminase
VITAEEARNIAVKSLSDEAVQRVENRITTAAAKRYYDVLVTEGEIGLEMLQSMRDYLETMGFTVGIVTSTFNGLQHSSLDISWAKVK